MTRSSSGLSVQGGEVTVWVLDPKALGLLFLRPSLRWCQSIGSWLVRVRPSRYKEIAGGLRAESVAEFSCTSGVRLPSGLTSMAVVGAEPAGCPVNRLSTVDNEASARDERRIVAAEECHCGGKVVG